MESCIHLDAWLANSHAHRSLYAALHGMLLLLLQEHFHIHFSSVPDCYSTLSALCCCCSAPGYPHVMTVLFKPLSKLVIFPSRWVLVPSDQLINYIVAWLCSAFLMLSYSLPFMLLAAPKVALAPLNRFSCKSVSSLSGSSMICENFLWLLSVLIPPWRAIINPTISDAPGSGCFVCWLGIFVSEKTSPNYFHVLS